VLIVCVALDVQRVFITNGIVEFFDEDRVAQRKRSILFVWGLGNEQRKVVIEKRWAKRALLKRIRWRPGGFYCRYPHRSSSQ
jgi:hypothetical protein